MSAQQYLQNNIGVQTNAQNNVPVNLNNGNPFTIYNQVPARGGYLPPVSNAYDEWRINPLQGAAGGNPFAPINQAPSLPFFGGSFNPGGGGSGGGGGGGWVSNPGGGGGSDGGGGTPVVTPPPNNNYGQGNLYPIGGGGWMLGGPGPTHGTGGGSLNTSYSTPGANFGLFGSGYNGMTPNPQTGSLTFSNPFSGIGNSIGNAIGNINWGLGGVAGNVADYFIPGDAIQYGRWNPGNIAAGVLDKYLFGNLPVVEQGGGWLVNKLIANNPNGWLATSDNGIARFLRNWDTFNDAADFQDQGGAVSIANIGRGIAGIGGIPQGAAGSQTPAAWVGTPFDPNGQQQTSTTPTNWGRFTPAVQPRPEDIYRSSGIGGLAAAGYTPAQINAITAAVTGGMGVGNAAAGAFSSGNLTGSLTGDAARAAIESMRLAALMTPTYQRHDKQT